MELYQTFLAECKPAIWVLEESYVKIWLEEPRDIKEVIIMIQPKTLKLTERKGKVERRHIDLTLCLWPM